MFFPAWRFRFVRAVWRPADLENHHMSDFDLEQLRLQRGGQPRSPSKAPHLRKGGQFHWDRAAFYKQSVASDQDPWGSGISTRSEPAPWMAPSKVGADSHDIRAASEWGDSGWQTRSVLELMQTEDPKCRSARLLALERTKERMEAMRQANAELRTNGPVDPAGDSELAASRRERWQQEIAHRAQLRGEEKAAAQQSEIERQEAEIQRNQERIQQLEEGAIEPEAIAKDELDDRNPKTSAARNEAFRQLQQTVAERREAERRTAMIHRQQEMLRQQKALIRRLARGEVEWVPPPTAPPRPDPKIAEKERLAKARAKARRYSPGRRRDRSSSPMETLSVASRRSAGLDARGVDAMTTYARQQMEALLPPALREAFAPLTSGPVVQPIMEKLGALEKTVAAMPSNHDARQALIATATRARSALSRALADRTGTAGPELVANCREMERVGAAFEPQFRAVWDALQSGPHGDGYLEPLRSLQMATRHPNTQQTEDGAHLYCDGADVARAFGEMLLDLADASDVSIQYNPLQNTARILERGLLRSDAPGEASHMCDVVSATAIVRNMGEVASLLHTVLSLSAQGRICITRAQDHMRSTGGTSTAASINGVRHVAVNFFFGHDPRRHVCELRVVHELFVALNERSGLLPGHALHSRIHFASEILEHLGATGAALPPGSLSALDTGSRRSDWQQHAQSPAESLAGSFAARPAQNGGGASGRRPSVSDFLSAVPAPLPMSSPPAHTQLAPLNGGGGRASTASLGGSMSGGLQHPSPQFSSSLLSPMPTAVQWPAAPRAPAALARAATDVQQHMQGKQVMFGSGAVSVMDYPANVAILEGIANILRGAPAINMRVHGETDNELRADLARARAKSCVDALVTMGVDVARLSSTAAVAEQRKVSFMPYMGELEL